MVADRRIHAAAGEWFIVRYERAGKWYIEYDPPRGRSAYPLKTRDAARLACDWEEVAAGVIHTGVPGGSVFDRLVRERKARAASSVEDSPSNKGKVL